MACLALGDLILALQASQSRPSKCPTVRFGRYQASSIPRQKNHNKDGYYNSHNRDTCHNNKIVYHVGIQIQQNVLGTGSGSSTKYFDR